MTQADRAYFDGYETARATCLTEGLAAALRALSARRGDAAWASGAELAIWDYEDANGLPHRV